MKWDRRGNKGANDVTSCRRSDDRPARQIKWIGAHACMEAHANTHKYNIWMCKTI